MARVSAFAGYPVQSRYLAIANRQAELRVRLYARKPQPDIGAAAHQLALFDLTIDDDEQNTAVNREY